MERATHADLVVRVPFDPAVLGKELRELGLKA